MALVTLASFEFLVLYAAVSSAPAMAAPGGVDSAHHLPGFLEARSDASAPPDQADRLAELEQMDQLAPAAVSDDYTLNARADRLEQALRPLFQLAPKDARGRIDAKAARYALHRLFIQRHAWHVNGISLQGAVRNSSRVAEALHFGEGFSLRQLARFAAKIESLVHADNLVHLQRSFDVLGLSRMTRNSEELAKQVTEAYMALFVERERSYRAPNFISLKAHLEKHYKRWNETKLFAEEVRRTISDRIREGEPLSLWEASSKVIEEIGERHGRWQNSICVSIKAKLVAMETLGTGRVPLSAFWGGQSPHFVESLPFLQQVGAIEGEAPHHSVLIPNYMNSASNCDAITKYHDCCCIDECEVVLGEIEARVGAMAATPQRLAELVRKIPSASVSAPFEINPTLLRRLEEGAAAQYDGLVPLHSRLFAQFLHHVYPRECSFPHLSVNASENMDEWLGHARVSKAFAEEYCSAAASGTHNRSQLSEEFPWTEDEELFMHSAWPDMYASRFSTTLKSLAASLAVSALVVLGRALISGSVYRSDKAHSSFV